MKPSFKTFSSLIILLLFVLYSLLGNTQQNVQQKFQPIPTQAPVLGTEDVQLYLVKKVIDGDTIEIEGGQKIRYIGIDAPESSFRSVPDCYSRESTQRNKELVEGRRVRLEKDVSETDRFGRLLRYVYVDTIFVNKQLVEDGFAYASSYPPDVKYQRVLQQVHEEARINKKGLWGNCAL